MTSDMSQWLAEVRSLQRRVAELQQECEQAYASADNWRNLYEAEAQQRRRDNATATSKIDRLQQDLAEIQSLPAVDVEQLTSGPFTSESDTQPSIEELQAQLQATQKQQQQLKVLLTNEQAQHAQTRESLTAALGDAVDLLAKERLSAEDI